MGLTFSKDGNVRAAGEDTASRGYSSAADDMPLNPIESDGVILRGSQELENSL